MFTSKGSRKPVSSCLRKATDRESEHPHTLNMKSKKCLKLTRMLPDLSVNEARTSKSHRKHKNTCISNFLFNATLLCWAAATAKRLSTAFLETCALQPGSPSKPLLVRNAALRPRTNFLPKPQERHLPTLQDILRPHAFIV